jgi:starch synthase
MKVLYACAELFPLLKTGGLADVSAALPPALLAEGCDVRLVMPAFPAIVEGTGRRKTVAALPAGPAAPAANIVRGQLKGSGLTVYLVDAPALFQRPGNPYLDASGREWPDSAQRFAVLGWAAACLGFGLDPGWAPDVVHGHDWHTGLAPAYVRAQAQARKAAGPATVFTIHNLAYQGVFGPATYGSLGLPPAMFGIDGVEFHGQVSFMKAGLQFSDRITTVSPTYAREILSPEQGWGLDGVLRARESVLSGILNGVDYGVWSPAADVLLAEPYDHDRLAGKAVAKAQLQQRLGLEAAPQALVFGVVSRLTEQKGLHLVPQVLDDLVARGGQLAVLGAGDAAIEQAFRAAAARHPGRVAMHVGYDEPLAHTVVAGSDVILVPSLFEPCGLTQLYGLRYGTLPLVRGVGGLADTVTDSSLENLHDGSATGMVFNDFTAAGLHAAVRRTFALRARPTDWAAVQQRGMQQRFDWRVAAQAYLRLYRELRPGTKTVRR